ncbi:hypothetical protein Acsp04_19490 [Actinomadura sp. NBRC 104425]|nr:hypothetical protein Acsp04_19490 [Actinomadura sp. NBRC 104425]
MLSGEIWAVLDETQVLMKAGDVLVQRGTAHAWSNRSDSPCLMTFVLIGGTPCRSGEQPARPGVTGRMGCPGGEWEGSPWDAAPVATVLRRRDQPTGTSSKPCTRFSAEEAMSDADRVVSTASVRTDRPGRYGKQLVSHLGRRATGEWDDESATGWIDFDGGGRVELSCGEGVLDLRLETAADGQARLEDVVGRHLVRFGTRDELLVEWTRGDGTRGTVQRSGTPP